MNRSRALIAVLAFGALPWTSARAADFPTLPDNIWYRVEIIIFERLGDVGVDSQGGSQGGSLEVLVSHAPRAYPRNALAFDDDSERAAAYALDDETLAIPVTSVIAAANSSTQAPANPAAPPTAAETAAKAIADYVTDLQSQAYRFQPDASLLLTDQDNRLRRSNGYRVLFHRAWIQPVPDRDQSQPMLIQAGEQVGRVRRIEGVLGVTQERYLHLDALLWYAVDPVTNAESAARSESGDDVQGTGADDTSAANTEPGYMELHEQRRMRSGELHYLDHPKFGVLVRVDPVQPPQALVTELARLAQPPAPATAPPSEPQVQPQ